MQQRTVAITGGNGFIGLRIVNNFLQNNWKVVATVRDAQNEKKTKDLKSLPNAQQNLQLVSADLLQESGFIEAFKNVDTVIHNASPVLQQGESTEENTVKPALEGTINVFNAILKNSGSIKNVVQISSTSAVCGAPGSKPKDYVFSADDWSDAVDQRQRNSWYNLSKTLAEQKVNEYKPEFDKLGIKLSSICPTLVVGPQLQTDYIPLTVNFATQYLTGSSKQIPNFSMSFVDVRDIAELVYQAVLKNAEGRYLGIEAGHTIEELAVILRKYAQEQHVKNIPTEVAEGDKASPTLFNLKKSVELLGRPFISFEQMIQDTLQSVYDKNLLK